jgi:hypothetical protein
MRTPVSRKRIDSEFYALANCPFCGSDAMMVEHPHGTAFVICTHNACKCQTAVWDVEGATERWNARQFLQTNVLLDIKNILETAKWIVSNAVFDIQLSHPNLTMQLRQTAKDLDVILANITNKIVR